MKRRYLMWLIAAVAIGTQSDAYGEKLEVGLSSSDIVTHPTREAVERGFATITVPAVLDSVYFEIAELVLTVTTSIDSTEPLLIGVAPVTNLSVRSALSSEGAWAAESTPGFDPDQMMIVPPLPSSTGGEIRLDVTHIVRRWLKDEAPNYGFVIRGLTEGKSTFHWIQDGRYEGADAKLVIHYSRL